jgi:hypothetical protein
VRNRFPSPARRAFALVTTLALMALVVLLALALLALARDAGTGGGGAAAQARANARLALALALGDLQKLAGPDQRVTARGDIAAADVARPWLTGIWESWPIDPRDPPGPRDYDRSKRARFRGWLASHPAAEAVRDPDFAKTAPPSEPGAAVILAGPQAFNDGAEAVAARAERLSWPQAGGSGGAAWLAIDEGVKARLDGTYDSSATSLGGRLAALGSGRHPAAWQIAGFEAVPRDAFDRAGREGPPPAAKWVTPATARLALAGGSAAGAAGIPPDWTTDSLGLPVDVARGGLRGDLNLLAERAELPAEFRGKGVYESLLGLAGEPTDPRWSLLHEFSRLYRDPRLARRDGLPVLAAGGPEAGRWRPARAGSTGADLLDPPPGPVLLPSIARVQVLFSLLARDIYSYPKDGAPAEDAPQLHSPWGNNFRNSSFDYLLHMIYTPVVTLHNPYNVALEFTGMKIDFVNVPFSLQVFRNGEPQTTALVPINHMYLPSQGQNHRKRFSLQLKDKAGSGPGGDTLRMLPGEVKVFSPWIPPDLTWAGEVGTQQYFFDWRNENDSENRGGTHVDTSKIVAIPGWRGEGIGYDLDWFAPAEFRVSDTEVENGRHMSRAGCIGMRATDRWHFEFAPLPYLRNNQAHDNRFTIEVSLAGRPGRAAVFEFDYERPTALQDLLLDGEPGKRLRYPREGTIGTLDMFDHASVPVRDLSRARPFALFSVQGKTTRGGMAVEDGRWATKPWAFAHPVAPVCRQLVTREHPAHHSHEIDLIAIAGSGDHIEIDPLDRGNFITGHTRASGLKFATAAEIPLAPLQSLPALNGANPAGSAGLPRFAAPVGNSWAHPLLPTSAPRGTGPGGESYLDHSFLLNLALADRFYHSGFASGAGPFADRRSLAGLAADFFAGRGGLADPRLGPRLPAGLSPAAAVAALGGDDGWRLAAAMQAVRGAFNVNSTSVEAWKAVLASLQAANAPLLAAGPGAAAESLGPLTPPRDRDARFSRHRLPNNESANFADDPDYAYWQGPRDLAPDELDRLARAIVRQVRLRGPFQSLGEFFNRRLGPPGPLTLAGALQAAIDEAGLNPGDAAAGPIIGDDPANALRYHPEGRAAAAGHSAQGAPGYLTQADLLAALGNAAAVRSDTFRVRAYGDLRDPGGRPRARAWCEAVVQRLPDFIDPGDPPESAPGDLQAQANRTFGRRFAVVSFRWLAAGEF